MFCVLSFAAHAQDVPEQSLLRRKVIASDGAALAMYRYRPAGGGEQFAPVLLVPDVGYGREAYDFEGRGLARSLQFHGRDAYVIELRGQGQSSHPANWSLRDWVQKDLPAAVAAVQSSHPGQVDLVVQGFGGALALAATTKELQGKIGRVIALSTPIAAEVPNDHVRKLLESGGRFSSLSKGEYELLFTHQAKFPSGVASEFRSRGLHDLSAAAATELLGWMKSGDFAFADGTTFTARFPDYDRPTIWFLPIADNFAHSEFGSHSRDVAPRAKIKMQELTRFSLMGEDYSHLSILLGSDVEADVFSRVHAFLTASDGATSIRAEETR